MTAIKNILLIEDNRALSNGILLALQNENTALTQCFTLASARAITEKTAFDLTILDINLPDGNGLNYLHELKSGSSMPVILLTANDMETDIVIGLESGADDYITKPFSLAVLRARVNTQLRKHTAASTRFEHNGFAFDFDKMEFYKNNTPIELSKTEQKLLRILVDNSGVTLERGALVDRVWTNSAEFVDENALSVTIKRLRDKLEDNPAKPVYIKTVYGIGYCWGVSQT